MLSGRRWQGQTLTIVLTFVATVVSGLGFDLISARLRCPDYRIRPARLGAPFCPDWAQR
ncbi:hypothetical protein B0H12DRAFT_1119423 [Mycena haematopus]|nr:hypothetical protein B0H12DRAFT_1170221 [Mycena haematopus]KAJ7218875.1 hypothetical protein B0H12DRAFT_1153011 [Mycena haematopus]KAJ7249729.1 hypothetical protein B0H12DRAFT_1121557 [Mycena haematopus]KAJ7251532.1 hypothetical protein B0H12DRAFT_1119423 [Mycena haematopus]